MFLYRSVWICFIACSLFISCTDPEVHLHDRHVLSYPLVASYAKKHPGTTLVLFDYHHDVGPLESSVLSSNWVGKLILDGTITRVIWISGRDLLLPNRNARIAWLHRKLVPFSSSDAKRIESHITLADWDDLQREQITGPLVVSLDFDIFCHDPGEPPERFLDEIVEWTARERPALLTLALSAAYQDTAKTAWEYLIRFVDVYGKKAQRSDWFLEAGINNPIAEGREERDAWRHWNEERVTFGYRNGSFLPGSAIWLVPPVALRHSLQKLSVQVGDNNAYDILSGWRDEELIRLENVYPQAVTNSILATAAESLESFWNGKEMPFPESSEDNLGIAIRIQADGADRGCFALYRGLSDPASSAAYCVQLAAQDPRYPEVLVSEKSQIDLEVSIFGVWQEMNNPYDFRPGLDSLLLIDDKEITLLQGSVAAERGYGRDAFLSRLSNKAGLGLQGWRKPGLRFARAVTIWSRRPLSSIETSEFYQK